MYNDRDIIDGIIGRFSRFPTILYLLIVQLRVVQSSMR